SAAYLRHALRPTPPPTTHHPSPTTHHPSPITHHPSPITEISTPTTHPVEILSNSSPAHPERRANHFIHLRRMHPHRLLTLVAGVLVASTATSASAQTLDSTTL